jgi:hypothetical protein
MPLHTRNPDRTFTNAPVIEISISKSTAVQKFQACRDTVLHESLSYPIMQLIQAQLQLILAGVKL